MAIKPRELAILVRISTGINPRLVDAISEAPTITIRSLGEGGKIFSMKAKKKRTT